MTKRVLIIDDDQQIRGLLVEMLRRRGFEAETAADGREGLEKARAEAFDLIITDNTMPVMGGIEMIKQMRLGELARKSVTHVPIILCAGDRGIVCDEADAIVKKPFKNIVMQVAIAMVVGD